MGIDVCRIRMVECRWKIWRYVEGREEGREEESRAGKENREQRNGEKEKSSYATAGNG